MKISLAKLPTPIEMLTRLGKRYEREIFVKRDDMTEFISSGNKIRKLEFLLAQALRESATQCSPAVENSRTTHAPLLICASSWV